MMKVLFVATSHDKMGDTIGKTGVWLEELAAPYYIFKDAGADITIASPNGGQVPLDPKSQAIIIATRSTKRFLKDEEAMKFLANAVTLEKVNAYDFDVLFLPGGRGVLWDLADNKILKQLLEAFHSSGKPIGALGHGVVGLMSLQNDFGESLLKGKNLTTFSNSEEISAGLSTVIPFLLESRLVSLGALYTSGPDYVSYVVEDGNIVTGQNPASSAEVAKKIVTLMMHTKHAATAF